MGMFKGNALQIINKWTWGFYGGMIGNVTAQTLNAIGMVDQVSDMEGMVAISGITSGGKAFTIGHYSFGPDKYQADWRDYLFVHEYGHYIQSQRMGVFYFPVVAIPSLCSAWFVDNLLDISHCNRWFEVDASTLGSKYFDRHYGRGAEGFKIGDPAFFDYNAYWTPEGTTSYVNPRTGKHIRSDNITKEIKHTVLDYLKL